jgi:hypothetical protein
MAAGACVPLEDKSVMGALLADYARIQLLSFLYKVLHVRHPCYLFLLFPLVQGFW